MKRNCNLSYMLVRSFAYLSLLLCLSPLILSRANSNGRQEFSRHERQVSGSKKSRKIIYAEAGKDFVDLLFSFLTLPLGSVMKSLSASGRPRKVGSVTNLYVSIEKLPALYINGDKSELLEPKLVSKHSSQNLLIDNEISSFYICRRANPIAIHYISTVPGETCACGHALDCPAEFSPNAYQSSSQVTGGGSSEGYVKDTITFIVTDDLNVAPSSTISSIELLNLHKVKDLSELEEKTASVGANEALELLWASLVSTTPLNDVFSRAVCMPANKRKD